MKCPGSNMKGWKPTDVYEVDCPKCGSSMEFFKDDSHRECECGVRIMNPKKDIGCREWCAYANVCYPGEINE